MPGFAKWRRFFSRSAIVGIGIVAVLIFDLKPEVAPSGPPTAEQARRVRDIAAQLRNQMANASPTATIRLDRTDLASSTALVGAIGGLRRIDSAIDHGVAIMRVSRPIGIIWLNGKIRISSNRGGFPEVRWTLGRLPLGPRASRWVVDGAVTLLRVGGVDVPPVDEFVRSVVIRDDIVYATISPPAGNRLADNLAQLRAQPVDPVKTTAIYCRLVEQNRLSPTDDMATVIRRAFSAFQADDTASIIEHNRAAFVALAIYAASRDSTRLAGDAAIRIRKCPSAHMAPRLASRVDLSRHWALSAALAVSLGNDIGQAMGEWKELSDSRAGGTGFSFVDLAADRAGLAVARRATDPATAPTMTKQLRSTDSTFILPTRALALAEGLSEDAFVKGFRSTDSAQFAAAKSRIDRVLARTQAVTTE